MLSILVLSTLYTPTTHPHPHPHPQGKAGRFSDPPGGRGLGTHACHAAFCMHLHACMWKSSVHVVWRRPSQLCEKDFLLWWVGLGMRHLGGLKQPHPTPRTPTRLPTITPTPHLPHPTTTHTFPTRTTTHTPVPATHTLPPSLPFLPPGR